VLFPLRSQTTRLTGVNDISATNTRPPRELLVQPGAIDHHIADLTVTASTDIALAALQQALGQHDQWLPIDGDPQLPLGRLVETNSSGPLRLGFGAWRDLLLGCQFTTSSGKLITVGGRTMKNVAGYDVTKFMVGQHGIFGKLLTLTSRSYKRPAAALLARMPYDVAKVSRLLTTACRPQWAMAREGTIYCGYLGDDAAIRFYESSLGTYEATDLKRWTLADDVGFRATNWLGNRRATLFRASVPPAKTLDFMQQVSDPTSAADPIFGIVVGSCSIGAESGAMEKAAEQFGGSIVFDDPARESFSGASGVRLHLLKRLQSAFQA